MTRIIEGTEASAHEVNCEQRGSVELGIIGAQYEERLLRRGRNAASIKNFRRAWLALNSFSLGRGKKPSELDGTDIAEFFAGLSYAPTTKRMYLAQIRAAYRYAVALGAHKNDPTIDLELPREPDRLIRTLSHDKLRELRCNCHNQRQWVLFHLFAYTGCRRNEIRELSWDAVNLEDQTIFVVGKYGKGRLVPIHPALGEALALSYKKNSTQAVTPNAYGRPYNYTYFDKLAKEFAPDVTLHDFRRTVASSLDANGVEEGLIMKIMGWAPKTIFDRHYRNIAPERLQNAILRLYANDPL